MTSLFDSLPHVTRLIRRLPIKTRFYYRGLRLTFQSWTSSGVSCTDENGKFYVLYVNAMIPDHAILD